MLTRNFSQNGNNLQWTVLYSSYAPVSWIQCLGLTLHFQIYLPKFLLRASVLCVRNAFSFDIFNMLRSFLPIPRNSNMVFAMLLLLITPDRISPFWICMSSLPYKLQEIRNNICFVDHSIPSTQERTWLSKCLIHIFWTTVQPITHHFFPTCPLLHRYHLS